MFQKGAIFLRSPLFSIEGTLGISDRKVAQIAYMPIDNNFVEKGRSLQQLRLIDKLKFNKRR
jgi:hypothetical protein